MGELTIYLIVITIIYKNSIIVNHVVYSILVKNIEQSSNVIY